MERPEQTERQYQQGGLCSHLLTLAHTGTGLWRKNRTGRRGSRKSDHKERAGIKKQGYLMLDLK